MFLKVYSVLVKTKIRLKVGWIRSIFRQVALLSKSAGIFYIMTGGICSIKRHIIIYFLDVLPSHHILTPGVSLPQKCQFLHRVLCMVTEVGFLPALWLGEYFSSSTLRKSWCSLPWLTFSLGLPASWITVVAKYLHTMEYLIEQNVWDFNSLG